MSRGSSHSLIVPLLLSATALDAAPAIDGRSCIDHLATVQYVKQTPLSASAIRSDGSILYASGNGTFETWKATRDGDLRLLVQVPSRGAARDLILDDGFAYVSSTNGVEIFDIQDPRTPASVAFLPGEWAYGLHLSKDVLWVADVSLGVTRYNVSNPRHPTQIGSPFAGVWSTLKAIPVGDRVYVLNPLGVETVDYTDIDNPVILHSLQLRSTMWRLEFLGGRLYATQNSQDPSGWGGLYVLDIQEDGTPSLTEQPFFRTYPGRPLAVDDKILVPAADLHVFRPSESGALEALAVAPGGRGANADIVLFGNHIFDSNGRVYRVESWESNTPSPLYGVGLLVDDFKVVGDLVYSFGRAGGGAQQSFGRLSISDFSDPDRPQRRGTLTFSAWGGSLAVQGTYAFVGAGGDFVVVDVADIDNPMILGSTTTPTRRLAVLGATVYATSRLVSALIVMDVGDPANPQEAARLALPERGGDVAIVNEHLIVSGESTGILVFDLSNPWLPFLVTTVPIPASGFTVSNERLYTHGSTVHVLDVSDARRPELIDSVDTFGTADLAVCGSFGYSVGQNGYQIIDFSGPRGVRASGAMEVLGRALEATPSFAECLRDRVVLVDRWPRSDSPGRSTARALPLQCAPVSSEEPDLARARPTSTVPKRANVILSAPRVQRATQTVSLDLVLAAPAQINASIYDVTGRRVRALRNAVLDAGTHTVRWNGRTDEGLRAAEGIYFARVQHGGHTSARKFLLPAR